MVKTKEELMDEAKALGLEPHHATGEAKLVEMINEALMASEEPEKVEKKVAVKALTSGQQRAALRKRQMKLSRITLRSNDERDKSKEGVTIQIICASGTVKKYIPFDNEDGWHVPQCVLKRLQEKKCVQFKNSRLKNGQKVRTAYEAKAYNVEILEPLTKKELQSLRDDQSARGSID